VSTAKAHFFLRSLIYHSDTIAFPVFVILVVRTEINQTEGKGDRDKIVHSGTHVHTHTHISAHPHKAINLYTQYGAVSKSVKKMLFCTGVNLTLSMPVSV